MSRLLAAFALALSLPAVACSSSGASGGAPPPKPATGAPLAFTVQKVTPGERGSIAVKAYNFSDKTVAGYGIMMRYADKAGQRVKVKVGTPFEKDFDFWSMSGRRYACKPRTASVQFCLRLVWLLSYNSHSLCLDFFRLVVEKQNCFSSH